MMLLISYLLLALPIFFFLIIFPRYKRSTKTHAPPGPLGLPLIGNLHQINTTNTFIYLWKLSKKYGPLMFMKLGSKPLLVISSPKMAEQILKTNDLTFSQRPLLYSTKKLSYNAMGMAFSPYNNHYKEMRKICILRLFSVKQVQSFRPVREDEVSRTMQRISSHASKHEVFNLSEMIMSLTNDIVCRVAFGKRCNEGSKRKRFDELIREYMRMLGGFFFSDYFPLLGWIDKINGVNARLENTVKELDLFLQEIIDEHLDDASRRTPESMEHNILSLLLQLRQEKSSQVELTMEHIKGLLLDIFVAGTDTSAIIIIWAMVALMKTPNIMKKVKEEIQGLGKNQGMITQDDIQKLSYLKAIIKETLRIYPPTPLLLPRETIATCTINGYEIRPETTVFVNAWAVARDPEYWENPDEFFPERFLKNNQIDYKGQHFGFIPFGGGRRGCPGISLGMATVELALANLLHSFDWELPPGMKKEDVDVDVFPGLVMAKKNPLYLVATKRSSLNVPVRIG